MTLKSGVRLITDEATMRTLVLFAVAEIEARSRLVEDDELRLLRLAARECKRCAQVLNPPVNS
jgi:hypothetical protein